MNTDATDDGPRRGRYAPSISERLTDWSEQLASAGVPSPQHDARALAAHALDVPPGHVFLLSGIESDDAMRIDELVRRRATREPLQYITGSVGFLGLDLSVGPGVFVPRPETELMADHVVNYLLEGRGDRRMIGRRDDLQSGQSVQSLAVPADQFLASNSGPPPGYEVIPAHAETISENPEAPENTQSAIERDGRILVVDLCSGSGALGLAVAANVANVACVGVEASPTASDYARRNAVNCQAELADRQSSFDVVEADAISVAGAELYHLRGAVDVVVCNPPYVPDDAIPRETEARDFDPSEALYGGPDGLDVVRQLVHTIARLLRPGGLLALEHADSQGEDAAAGGVPGLLRDHLWTADEESQPESVFQRVVDHLDLNGRPRFTTAIRSA